MAGAQWGRRQQPPSSLRKKGKKVSLTENLQRTRPTWYMGHATMDVCKRGAEIDTLGGLPGGSDINIKICRKVGS